MSEILGERLERRDAAFGENVLDEDGRRRQARAKLWTGLIADLARCAANRLERGNVAAQNRLQILVNDEQNSRRASHRA